MGIVRVSAAWPSTTPLHTTTCSSSAGTPKTSNTIAAIASLARAHPPEVQGRQTVPLIATDSNTEQQHCPHRLAQGKHMQQLAAQDRRNAQQYQMFYLWCSILSEQHKRESSPMHLRHITMHEHQELLFMRCTSWLVGRMF